MDYKCHRVLIVTQTYHLLKYSSKRAKQFKMHSAIHAPMPPSSALRAVCAKRRKASRMATSKLPKQMDPNEVVMARKNELLRADEQQQFASEGSNHQLPTIPATVT